MLSTQKKNIILKNTQDWMEKRITVYKVSKLAHCKWETANTHLHQFAPLIKAKEQEIIEKLTKTDENEKRGGLFQKLKTRILSLMIKGSLMTQTPK